jgi:signal transduction histidine kinase
VLTVPAPRAPRIAGAAGALVALLGLCVFAGWVVDSDALKLAIPGIITMKANTAVCFALLGTAVWLERYGPRPAPGAGRTGIAPARRAAIALGLVVASVGALSMVEWITGINLGIDEILFSDHAGPIATPGRMSPLTATCFMLLGAALLVNDRRAGKRVWFAGPLVLTSWFVTLLGLLTYLLGATADVSSRAVMATNMAIPTAVALAVACIGVACTRPNHGLMYVLTSDAVGGRLARILLPVTLGVLTVFAYLRLVGQQAGLYDTEFGSVLLTTTSAATLWAILLPLCRRLDAAHVVQRQLVTELKHADQKKGIYVAVASHELRTPLIAIRGFTRLLIERWETVPDAEKLRFAAIIDQQAARLSRMVGDLLQVSRIESGQMKVRPEAVEIRSALHAVVDELGGDDVTWEGLDPATAWIDPDHFKQIIINLIANARSHGKPPIRIGSELEGEDLLLRVVDHGPGILAIQAEHIFDTFTQLTHGGHATHEQGAGLGLAIARGLARLHGGDVWFDPEWRDGSCFVVRLPRHVAAAT